MRYHTTYRTQHTAHRTQHTAHRTQHTAHRTPHTTHSTSSHLVSKCEESSVGLLCGCVNEGQELIEGTKHNPREDTDEPCRGEEERRRGEEKGRRGEGEKGKDTLDVSIQ